MSIEEQLNSTSKYDPLKKIILNIMYTGSWVNEKSSVFFKQYDLTSQQFNILRILRGQKGNPINLRDVQERMISKMSNTTRLIDKLRLKGMVTREQCESNRRKIDIVITEKGMSLLKEIDTTISSHEMSISQNLSCVEAEQLNELLNKLRVNNK
ncbi:MarR family transcriptional regulator [Flavicella sp.]|uniref:MarR family winged helix-turn-helix transcriptional regulator n=1 Tax=Flavicella sp. TaxID=2957742 RepID=UPI00301969D5